MVFFTCELGQLFTNTLSNVNDEFVQLDWYLFPVKVQRMLPTVINNVQKPVEIECFGIMSASRDQFKMVYQSNNINVLFLICVNKSQFYLFIGGQGCV